MSTKTLAGHAIEFVEVPTVTLATLIKERAADVRSVRLLVKIDVEIHEVAVLQGLEDMLAEFEEFAALVEIVHLAAADIEWLLLRFDIELLDTEGGKLTKIDLTTPAELKACYPVRNSIDRMRCFGGEGISIARQVNKQASSPD